MKIKTIAASVALVTLSSISIALAGQGENTLGFTLNADLSQATPGNDVQIRVYNQGNELPSANIVANLKEVLDPEGNIVWGSTGQVDSNKTQPQIDPKDMYVVEVYSNTGTITYTQLSTTCNPVSMQQGGDTTNVLTANCMGVIMKVGSIANLYIGDPHQVPSELAQVVASPQYFKENTTSTYTMPSQITAGKALYFPLAFFAHLPNWRDDLSNYQPGNYTASGDMIIRGEWK